VAAVTRNPNAERFQLTTPLGTVRFTHRVLIDDWFHIAIVFTADTCTYVIDGVQQFSESWTGVSSLTNVAIG
jgi:hypothetical protein